MDSRKSLSARDLRMGIGRSYFYNFSTTMGSALAIGNVTFISQMDGQFTPCLSQMETKLSVKLT